MLCKKCGAEIADASKFCGYCGNPVEVSNETNVNPQPVNNVENIDLNQEDLGNTIRIEPLQQEVNNEPNISSQINQSEVNVQPVEMHNEPVEQIHSIGPGLPEYEQQTVVPQSEMAMVSSVNVQPVIQPSPAEPNKKNNKLMIIIGGVVLAVVAVISVILAFNFLGNDKPLTALKKAIANLQENGKNSATVNANVSIATSTGESMTLSATVKTVMKSDNEFDMQVTVNESLFFDEMNIYLTTTNQEIKMYLESTLIDMMGTTSSLTPTWVYYTMPLEEIMEEFNSYESEMEIDIEELIDEKHFVFIDEVNELRHYQLIIDQELIDTMKAKLADIDDEDIKEMIDSMETLEEIIKVDFYITSSNEFSKIELDMTEYLEDTELSSFVIGIELKDLNNTKVEIPSDAEKATVDLETYMTQYAVTDYGHDTQIDAGYGTDFGFDSDSVYDGMNDEFDYDYDYSYDASLDNMGYGF